MLLHIPEVLSREQVVGFRAKLDQAGWVDGKITAGTQSAQVKRNEQLPESDATAQEIRAAILDALGRNALFFSAALPKKIYPPLFNRYRGGMDFGSHIDNAVRTFAATGESIRTDLSCTLFLAEPEDYDGGELLVEDTYGLQSVKLAAGDMVLYPASSLHRVQPVTRGARVASFFWIQSMVRDDAQRALLFNMDMAISNLRAQLGETEELVTLTGSYHNLLRMWADI